MMTVELKMFGRKADQVQVRTLREASQKVSEFIREENIGSSVWEGGTVRVDGKKAFLVSYNGRVWVGTMSWTPDTREVTGDDLDNNRDLRTEVNEGRFRSDLYFRLALIRVKVPALREHLEDIPLLVERLLGASRNTSPEIAASLTSPDFIATLQRGSWPGNVRELRNHLESCLVLRQVLPFGSPSQPPPTQASPSHSIAVDAGLPYHQARMQSQVAWEAQYLRALLSRHEDNVNRAAQAAGISRAYLYRLLSRHGIRRGP